GAVYEVVAAKAVSLVTTAPTRLSGVEAPDVRPMRTGPSAGSQPSEVISVFDAPWRCRISAGDIRHSGSAMWYVGRATEQSRARFAVLLLLYPPITMTRSTGFSRNNARTASCRSCVALQMVSNAWKRLARSP